MNTATMASPLLYTHTFNNGLQVVAQPMANYESVAISYYVRTGSRDEFDPRDAGISHFLEHMVFKGTHTMNAQHIVRVSNSIGAELNAFTSYESTTFFARVLSEYLDQALMLLSDMMCPLLAENDFENEKEVIVNEIARSEDQPYSLAYRHMMQTYFGNHPLGHDILGTRESIRSMHVEQIRHYWHQHYAADNLILAVAGNFDWSQLLELAEQQCGHWRTGTAKRPVERYELPHSARTIIVEPKLKQQLLLIALPATDSGDDDYYAIQLACNILGEEGSRLYWNISQKGLAESASASIWALEGSGLMIVEANSTPKEAPHVLRLLYAELERWLEDGVTEEELCLAKSRLISTLVLSGESPFSRMRSLAADWVIEGRLLSLDEEVERIEKVTTNDVIRALRRFPMREKQVLTTLGPLSEAELLI